MKTVYLLASMSFCLFLYLVYTAGDKYYLEENYYVFKELPAERVFKAGAFQDRIAPRIIPVSRENFGMEHYMEFGIIGFVYSEYENYLNEGTDTVAKQQIVRITGEGIRNEDGWVTTILGKKQEGVNPVIEIDGKRYITLESQFKDGYLVIN